jgi:hypothetical protein
MPKSTAASDAAWLSVAGCAPLPDPAQQAAPAPSVANEPAVSIPGAKMSRSAGALGKAADAGGAEAEPSDDRNVGAAERAEEDAWDDGAGDCTDDDCQSESAD